MAKMNQSDFFNTLFQFCEGKIEVRPIPGEPDFFDIDDLGEISAYCKTHKSKNLFIGLATRDGKTTPEGKKGGKDNIVDIPCVWCDVDFKDIPMEMVREKLSAFPFKPSIIVKSGGGVHLYWLLKEPVGQDDITAIEDINHRIADNLGGDHNSCDAARVLRIPGTKNRKYNPPRECEAVRIENSFFALDDFQGLPNSNHHKTNEAGQKQNEPGWIEDAMRGIDKTKTPEVSRNAMGTKIAGYFINKLPKHDALTILQMWNLNNKPPLGDAELQTIINSISRYKEPEISTKARVDMSNVYDSARMLEEYLAYIKTLKQNRFITGIREIDKRIRGVAGGEVLTIIARSGSFKTAMLQNLLKNYIDHSSWASVFFSIEMPVSSLAERYLEILDGCTGKEVEQLFSDPSEANIQRTAENSFKHELDKLFVIPTRVSLSDISGYVQLIEKERNVKVGVIGIDYLGLMEGPGVSEYETVSRLSTGLKSTAKLLNIPVIVLAQVSRKGASGNTEISLDMGRGSGAIEEAADFVLGLWQAGDEDSEKELICKILKNRKGPVGSRWKLDLIPQTLQIGANAEKYEPPKNARGGF